MGWNRKALCWSTEDTENTEKGRKRDHFTIRFNSSDSLALPALTRGGRFPLLCLPCFPWTSEASPLAAFRPFRVFRVFRGRAKRLGGRAPTVSGRLFRGCNTR